MFPGYRQLLTHSCWVGGDIFSSNTIPCITQQRNTRYSGAEHIRHSALIVTCNEYMYSQSRLGHYTCSGDWWMDQKRAQSDVLKKTHVRGWNDKSCESHIRALKTLILSSLLWCAASQKQIKLTFKIIFAATLKKIATVGKGGREKRQIFLMVFYSIWDLCCEPFKRGQ